MYKKSTNKKNYAGRPQVIISYDMLHLVCIQAPYRVCMTRYPVSDQALPLGKYLKYGGR